MGDPYNSDFWNQQRDKMYEAMVDDVSATAELGVEGGAKAIIQQGLDANWSQVNDTARVWAQTYTYDLVSHITETTSNVMSTFVSEWVAEGRPLGDLVDVMVEDAQFEGMFGRKRAELIAQTETTRAFAEGNMLIWEDSGHVKGTLWHTVEDSNVDDICWENAAAGVVKLGEAFPSGDNMPPAHPGCRCYLAPSVTGVSPAPSTPTAPTVPAVPEPVAITTEFINLKEHLQISEQAGRLYADDTIAQIQKVHEVPPTVRASEVTHIVPDDFGTGTQGAYWPSDGHIVVRPKGEHPHLTFAHEMGHKLDYEAFTSERDFGIMSRAKLSNEPVWNAWREAVQDTSSYRYWDYVAQGQGIYPAEFGKYMTSEVELWARSYSQYIAESAPVWHPLREEMAAELGSSFTGLWKRGDFDRVREAIDGILEHYGYKK